MAAWRDEKLRRFDQNIGNILERAQHGPEGAIPNDMNICPVRECQRLPIVAQSSRNVDYLLIGCNNEWESQGLSVPAALKRTNTALLVLYIEPLCLQTKVLS
jgi:hypothetical protein